VTVLLRTRVPALCSCQAVRCALAMSELGRRRRCCRIVAMGTSGHNWHVVHMALRAALALLQAGWALLHEAGRAIGAPHSHVLCHAWAGTAAWLPGGGMLTVGKSASVIAWAGMGMGVVCRGMLVSSCWRCCMPFEAGYRSVNVRAVLGLLAAASKRLLPFGLVNAPARLALRQLRLLPQCMLARCQGLPSHADAACCVLCSEHGVASLGKGAELHSRATSYDREAKRGQGRLGSGVWEVISCG
jgi:hypothetical protein